MPGNDHADEEDGGDDVNECKQVKGTQGRSRIGTGQKMEVGSLGYLVTNLVKNFVTNLVMNLVNHRIW